MREGYNAARGLISRDIAEYFHRNVFLRKRIIYIFDSDLVWRMQLMIIKG
jgi:hypothetical protein